MIQALMAEETEANLSVNAMTRAWGKLGFQAGYRVELPPRPLARVAEPAKTRKTMFPGPLSPRQVAVSVPLRGL